MALSTKDVKTGGEGGGLPKTIQPGNTSAQILEVRLDQPNFLVKENGYFLILEMMTPKPTEDFVGFLLNKDNPDGGNYEGPVGRVKGSRWAFRDGKTKSGIEIKRDNEIMKYLKNLCEALGGAAMTWWDASDEKYNTIEEMVEAFNADAPFKGIEMNYCICGRESRLLVFDEADHIEKAEPREVDEFSGDEENAEEETTADIGGGDASPPAEFEL
jgi:hypothetical protein